MATIYEPNMEPRDVEPADGVSFTLAELQAAVGGYIEMITLGYYPNGDRDALFVNEEGLLQALPGNPLATRLALAAGLALAPPAEMIVGTAIRCRCRPETETAPEWIL